MAQGGADVRYWYEKLGYCVAAVSEGLLNENGQEFGSTGKAELDAFGHARKGDVLGVLADAIKAELGLTARLDKPGYLQRSFGDLMSPEDREKLSRRSAAFARRWRANRTRWKRCCEARSRLVIETVKRADEVSNVERKLPMRSLTLKAWRDRWLYQLRSPADRRAAHTLCPPANTSRKARRALTPNGDWSEARGLRSSPFVCIAGR